MIHRTIQEKSSTTASSTIADTSSKHFWQLPAPVKHVFAAFPVTTLPPTGRPERCPKDSVGHILHVFTSDEAAIRGFPSFNPACLKWQTYLKFCQLDFTIVPANNHASPNGVLPFLQLNSSCGAVSTVKDIPGNKLSKWISSQSEIARNIPVFQDYEVYFSLIEREIRNSWLFTLYLDRQNSRAVAQHLYINPCSNNTFVREVLFKQLQQAAKEELNKAVPFITEEELLSEAGRAFWALSKLLAEENYFSREKKPSFLDASLFAYTHPLLDSTLKWRNHRLENKLRQYDNLVCHRQRLLDAYYPQS